MAVGRLTIFLLSLFILVASSSHAASKDMPGSKDHPKIPRIEGSVIFGFEYSDYDESTFLKKGGDKYSFSGAAGKQTRILYLASKDVSTPAVVRNYEVALGELGEIELIYSCDSDCPYDLAQGLIWKEDRRIATIIKGDQYLYQTSNRGRNPENFARQGYAYWIVTTDEARFHVSVYTALFVRGGIFRMDPDVTNTRSVHVNIVEEADFEPTLQVVTPDEIVEGVTQKGRIALYGIHFDFDSDVLKPDSAPALEAIAAALGRDSSLKIYVVGHTDNQGSYDYNWSLSERRARSVVTALTENYGVAEDRLVAAGVGPVAPTSSNRTEEGQALNRRVELVEQ